MRLLRKWSSLFCSLFAVDRQPLDELALGEEVDQDHGQGDYERRCHQVSPIDLIAAAEEAQTQHEGVFALVVEEDQGRQEVVPGCLESENRHGCQGGARQWEDDVPEYLQGSRTVHHSCIFQILGDLAESLAQEEDVEWVPKESRHDQGEEAVDPAQAGKDDVQRYHGDRVREHERRQHQHEKEFAPGSFQAGKAIGDHRTREQMPEDGESSNEDRIEGEASKGQGGQGFGEVGPLGVIRPPDRRRGEDGETRFEGGRDHPEDGQKEYGRDKNHEHIAEDQRPIPGLADEGCPRFRHRRLLQDKKPRSAGCARGAT